MKLSELEGEDVDVAISLLRSTYSALESASTPSRNYIPDDFPRTIMQVLQTSSVPEFNQAFADEETDILREADRSGTKPSWPDVYVTLDYASNVYQRLKADNIWCLPAGNKSSSFNYTVTCWNCGGNHLLSECSKPRDEAKIDKARKAYRSRNKGKGKKGRKSKTDDKGRPLKLNKNQVYVVDSKKWKAILANRKSSKDKDEKDNSTHKPQKDSGRKDQLKALVANLKQSYTAQNDQASSNSGSSTEHSFSEQLDLLNTAIDDF